MASETNTSSAGTDVPPVPAPPVDRPSTNDIDPDENVPHPTLELYRHTMLRGANAGSLLALIFSPPILYYRGVRQPTELLRRVGGVCAKGAVIGLVVGGLMTVMRTYGNAEEQIYDRSYRLRKNQGQCRMDRFSYGFALVGGAVGAGLGGFTGLQHGASMGLGLAVLAHVCPLGKGKSKEE